MILMTAAAPCVLLTVGAVLWASYQDRIPNRSLVRVIVLVGAIAGTVLYIGHSIDHLL